MQKEWNTGDGGRYYRCMSVLYALLDELHVEQPLTDEEDRRIEATAAYIRANGLRRDFSLTEAICASHYSEVYVRKLFRRRYGVTPNRYLLALRMKHGRSLLKSGYFSVEEVAEECGYGDANYFSFVFKKETGISPRAYAQEYAGKQK